MQTCNTNNDNEHSKSYVTIIRADLASQELYGSIGSSVDQC